MNALLVALWTFLILTSIAWYGFLVFYVGYKGAGEIRQMTKDLQNKNDAAPSSSNET